MATENDVAKALLGLLEFLDENDVRDGHHFDENGHEKWRTDAFEDCLEAAWSALGREYLREERSW